MVYPDIIRKVLTIPDDKAIALGIGIGYEDTSVPPIHDRTTREPLDKVVKFYGF